jgi:hypothetical protein
VLHPPDDLQVPVLLPAGLEADALEGNPHLDLVAAGHQPALRLPGEIGTQVGRLTGRDLGTEAAGGAPRFHERAVELDAEGIHAEHRGLAPVVEGAEHDRHVVVGGDPVAVGEGGVDLPVRLARANAEVDRRRRVPDQHVGRVGGGNPVLRVELRKIAQPGCSGPGRLVEHAVDLDARVDPRSGDRGTAKPPAEDQQGVRRASRTGLEEQEQGEQHEAWMVTGGGPHREMTGPSVATRGPEREFRQNYAAESGSRDRFDR